MEQGQLRDFNYAEDKKRKYFDGIINDASYLLDIMGEFQWTNPRLLNAMSFAIGAIMKSGKKDEEDLRMFLAGIMNNYKLM